MIEPSRYESIGEILGDALLLFKEQPALVEWDRKRIIARYTYGEVRQEMLRVAQGLATAGIKGGDRVAILMSNQAKWLVTATAVFHRGAVLVPVDYKLTPPEQRALLAHSGVTLLVTEYGVWRRLEEAPCEQIVVTEAPAEAPLGRAQRWETLGTRTNGASLPPLAFVPRRRDDPATIVYSSGTGGRPKGCVQTHDAYLEQLRELSTLYPMVTGDRSFSVLPTNHAIDFLCGFLGPWCGGATVVHQRTLRPEFLLETMRGSQITHMAVVPLLLAAFERAIREKIDARPAYQRRILEALATANEKLTRRAPHRDLSRRLLAPIHDALGGHLKLLLCGGAFVDRARAEFFYRLGIPVVIGYGLTEACTVATVQDLKPFRADSVGRPLPGVELRVVKPDAHGVGEVQLRGRSVMQGYLDDPELTAAAFDDGWLRTGDLGYLDASHHLHLVGRGKNMIVTAGGKNVYPEDIEGAFEGLPSEELAVFSTTYLWPETSLTDEALIVVARVENAPTFNDELRRRNCQLADFKRVRGVLRWPDSFPRTASMKLKREELANLLRARTKRSDVHDLEADARA